MSHRLAQIQSDENSLRATWGNLFVVSWRKAMAPQTLDAIEREVKAFAERQPGGIVYLSIVERMDEHPSPEAMRRMRGIANSLTSRIRAVVLVFGGNKLLGAFARIAFNTVNMVASPSCPRVACARVEDAKKHLAKHVEIDGRPAAAEEIAAALGQLRVGSRAA